MPAPTAKRPVGTPPKHGDRALSVTPHPHPRYADRIRLIRWRRGPDNPTIEASVRLPDGSWTKPFSLRTPDEMVAQLNAVEELTKREQLHASGLPQPSRTPKVKLAPRQPAPAVVGPGSTMASATHSMPAVPAALAKPATPSDQTFGVAAMAVVKRLETLHRETGEREGRQKAEVVSIRRTV